MKPLRLEIEGLHSFRERQVVDFEALSGYGVFGIFGPTGSGKSTILDALTLALYGTVVRARRDTQGILNQSERRLRVSLHFALGKGDIRRHYRVERSYARGVDFGVKGGTSRLVEVLSDGERVLEDLPGRITARIEAILGLTAEDFTRAVVLPQGRFAEFLTLAGKDRRLMLERLFALETYGQRLTAVLLHHRQETAQRLGTIQGEQTGLGDASPAMVETVRLAHQAAREALAARTEQLESAQARHRRHARLRELQEELRAVRQSLAEWEGRQAEIVRLEERIHIARAAEGLRPALQGRSAAQAAATEARSRRFHAGSACSRLQEQTASAWQERQLRERQREEEEPLLLRQQGRLQRALDLQREIDALLPSLQDLERGIAGQEERERRLEEERERLLQARQRAEQDFSGVQERLLTCSIPAGERRRIHEVFDAWRSLADARQVAAAEATETAGKEQAVAVARRQAQAAGDLRERALEQQTERRRALQKWQEDRPDTDDEVQAARERLESLRQQARESARLEAERSRLEGEVRQQTERLQALLRQEEEAEGALQAERERVEGLRREERLAEEGLEEARLRHLAATLSSRLAADAPCPVCGSRQHPAPARAGEEDPGRQHLEEIRQAREAAERDLREAEGNGRALDGRRQGQEGLLRDRRLALADVGAQMASLGAGPAAELGRRVEQEGEALRQRVERLRRWQEEGERLGARTAEAQEDSARATEAAARAEAAFQAAEAVLAETWDRWQRAQEQSADREARLDQVRGDLPAGEIAIRYRELEERDRQAATLEREQSDLQARLEEIRQRSGEREREGEVLARELAVLAERRQGLQREVSGREAERDALTGGRPVEEGLRETGERLGELRRLLQEADAAWNGARDALGLAEQALAAAAGQESEAERRLADAEATLTTGLAETGFATATEAEAALLPPPQRLAWEQEVARFREEQIRLRREAGRLADQVGEDRLTPEEWEETEALLAATEAAHRQAISAEGVALRALEEIREKEARWQELERQRGTLEGEATRLSHLQEMLKGNALVEFLAREQLEQVARDASHRLARLTRGRFALEVAGQDGFLMRDHGSGGQLRPVHTLSGGETFLVSLALSLSLSSQIQLRGEHPLEFFFLDEGFGTLDPGLLDTVMGALEHLHLDNMMIGVISHVAEIRSRLQRRLIVEPAEPGGRGTRLRLERA